ncbi:MAG: winged helix-turn-helix domain-containing protein [Nanoarchaeota archaeon]
MRFYQRKITIINIRKPADENINQDLQWLGHSLGLFNLRDKDKSCFRTFIELLKAAKVKRPLTSDELAYHLDLSRGTVIHHINNLMSSGLVSQEHNRYMLRVDNLKDLIDEVEEDIRRTCKSLRTIAEKIDSRLGL